MWTRKALKKQSKHTLKQNYWRAVIVCLIMAFFVGAYYHTYSTADFNQTTRVILNNVPNSQVVSRFLRNFIDEVGLDKVLPDEKRQGSPAHVATRGVLATLFNNITQAGSFVFGILNSLNQFIFRERVWAGITILLGAGLSFLYWLLAGNILRLGQCRFFLESKLYPDTAVRRLLYIYKIRRVRRVANIMFRKTLYIVCWCFTIVGGVYKFYGYRMINYLVAENPDIDPKEVFRLSERLMYGHKWRLFLLDASFWAWDLLSVLTLGFVGYLFVNPYKAGTEAELYRTLRAEALAQDASLAEQMNDRYLTAPPEPTGFETLPWEEYPLHLFAIAEHPSRRWLTADYHRKYSLRSLILLFFTYCIIGYIWEVLYYLFGSGVLINRGTLWGPWLPIYGVGGVLVLILLRKWVDRPALTFALVVLICAVVEYFTGWALEAFFHEKWWDYSGFLLNLNGRICLEGLLAFGIGGSASIYFAAPLLDNLYKKIPRKVQTVLCVVLITLFVADIAYSLYNPHTGEGITTEPDLSQVQLETEG